MAVSRRPFRRRTGRTLRNKIEKIEKQQLRKTMGMWQYLNTASTLTTSATAKGKAIVGFNPGEDRKLTLYGLDLLIGLQLDAGTSQALQGGALVVAHVRVGQDFANFLGENLALPAEGAAGESVARFRAFLPFMLSNREGGTAASAVVPYRLFRGREITLMPGESLVIGVAFDHSVPNNTKLYTVTTGRLRYIDEPVSSWT